MWSDCSVDTWHGITFFLRHRFTYIAFNEIWQFIHISGIFYFHGFTPPVASPHPYPFNFCFCNYFWFTVNVWIEMNTSHLPLSHCERMKFGEKVLIRVLWVNWLVNEVDMPAEKINSVEFQYEWSTNMSLCINWKWKNSKRMCNTLNMEAATRRNKIPVSGKFILPNMQ